MIWVLAVREAYSHRGASFRSTWLWIPWPWSFFPRGFEEHGTRDSCSGESHGYTEIPLPQRSEPHQAKRRPDDERGTTALSWERKAAREGRKAERRTSDYIRERDAPRAYRVF